MKQKNVILMVVAVGCGLVAAFLTSQMSAKGQVEQVDVIVAAKDLPVGTTITREDVDKMVKVKKVPKDGLPPAYVLNKEDLLDKRLARPVRTEETFNPQDLLKGGAITLPPGYGMVSLPVGVGQAAAGFVGPGSRVDVIATVRLSNKLQAFPLLINMLVVAVDTQTTYQTNGVFPTMSMVSFAVKDKEALVLSLAKSRGCTLELLLRHPETSNQNDTNDKLDQVVRQLSEPDNQAKIISGDSNPETPKDTKPADPVKPADPIKPVEPSPYPSIKVVKVLVATRDIEPNTLVTNDLVKEAFEWKELPKDYANDALTDLSEALGKAFKTGVAKNQWVTWSMLGLQGPKAGPQDKWVDPKPGVTDAQPVAKPKTLDVAMHTASGTVIHRYVEMPNGQWKKMAELTPEQAAKDAQRESPKANPDARKLD